MNQAEARRSLQGIIGLADNRSAWLRPLATEVCFREERAPTLVRTWRLVPGEVVAVLESIGITRRRHRPIFLPVMPDGITRDDRVEARLVTTKGTTTVELFEASHIVAAAGDDIPAEELLDELLVEVDWRTFDRCLQFRTVVPFHLQRVRDVQVTSTHPGRQPVSCLGLRLDGLAPTEVSVRLPDEVTAEWAVYEVEIRPPEGMTSLAAALHPLRGQEIEALVAGRQIRRVAACIESARATVASLEELVEPHAAPPAAPGGAPDAAPGAMAQLHQSLLARFHEIDENLKKAHHRAEALLQEPSVQVADLLQGLQQCDRQLRTIPRVRIPVPVDASNSSTLRPAPAFDVKRVRIPYTSNVSELRERRLGGPLSLAIMATVLLIIAWRLWLVFPIGSVPSAPERADGFAASRESIVAILLIFPALLATQLEQRGRYPILADNSIGVATTCAQIGLAMPLLIAVLSVGDVRYNLLCGSCLVAGVILLVMAAWTYFFYGRPATLAQMRQRRVLREAAP